MKRYTAQATRFMPVATLCPVGRGNAVMSCNHLLPSRSPEYKRLRSNLRRTAAVEKRDFLQWVEGAGSRFRKAARRMPRKQPFNSALRLRAGCRLSNTAYQLKSRPLEMILTPRYYFRPVCVTLKHNCKCRRCPCLSFARFA